MNSGRPIAAVFVDFGGVLYRAPNVEWVHRWQVLVGLRNDPLVSALVAAPEDSAVFMAINKKTPLPSVVLKHGMDFEHVKTIKYDFLWASKNRELILKRWTEQVFSQSR